MSAAYCTGGRPVPFVKKSTRRPLARTRSTVSAAPGIGCAPRGPLGSFACSNVPSTSKTTASMWLSRLIVRARAPRAPSR